MQTFSEFRKTIRFDWFKTDEEIELIASAGSDLSIRILGFVSETRTKEHIRSIAEQQLYWLYVHLLE